MTPTKPLAPWEPTTREQAELDREYWADRDDDDPDEYEAA